ncbi:MAG: hypothetical protein P4M05_01695 [Bradyrhizobium sp.]|nr:hypothetical protein [Bradyrhizobium sp.]
MVVPQTSLTYRHPEFSRPFILTALDRHEPCSRPYRGQALAGQSAGSIDAVKSAQHIIDETVAQFFAITGRLGGLAAAHAFG